MSDDQRADTPLPEPRTKAGQAMESWLREPEDYAWGRKVTDAILAIEAEAYDAGDTVAMDRTQAAAEPAALVAAVRRMVEDGHPNDPDWFRIITEHLHKAESEPAAAEPPAPTGDNDADTRALIEAWGEPEVQAEGMSVKQWERHVADLRERAAQPPRGVTPALDVERLAESLDSHAPPPDWGTDMHQFAYQHGTNHETRCLPHARRILARLGSPEDSDG